MHRVAEFRLILGEAIEPVEPRADLVFQHRAPEVDHLAGGRGRRQTREAFAHQHRQRVRQRRIGAVGDLVELAAMEMIVEHRGEIFGDPGHPPRTQRFDAGLLDRFEHAARLRIARHQLAVHFRIVTGKFQRDRIGMTPHDRSVALGHLARRLRQPRLARRETGALGGEGYFQLRLFRDRAQAGRHRALERLGRRFLRSGAEFLVGRRHFSPIAPVASSPPSSLRKQGPITTSGRCSPEIWHHHSTEMPRRMGPCVRRDDNQLIATLTDDSGSSTLKQR